MKQQRKTAKKSLRLKKRNRLIIISVIALLVFSCACYLVSRAHIIKNSPEKLFDNDDLTGQAISSQDQTSSKSDISMESEEPDSVVTSDQDISTSPKDNIVNILLLGIDRTADGGTSSGTMPHADAIVVVAINFSDKSISLVSLPRDSFVNMPSVKGFYKLNCMFNVGGGYSSPDGGGFKSMCAAAQWTLGGIPINYYYSVDFDALISLVDAIGGVDFDMDMSYQGDYGYYHKGAQHLDGLGVLDYMRARHNATIGANDRERTNRQKRMLIAVFNQLEKSNLLETIPKALSSVKGKYFTNTNLEQTLAIANFAREISSDLISTYSLFGDYKAGPIAWNWTFIDPANRIDVIQKVWGVTVSPLERTSYEFMQWLKDFGFRAIKYKSTAENVEQFAEKITEFTTLQQAANDDFKSSLVNFNKWYEIASNSLSTEDTDEMLAAQDDLRTKTQYLAEAINYTEVMDWSVASSWDQDPGINEVYVDFR